MMMPLSGLFVLLSVICFVPTWALTDCFDDNCICVWNLKMEVPIPLNGVYRIVDGAATGSDREWMNDDFKNSLHGTTACNDEAKYFWMSAAAAYRWFLGDESYRGSGTHDCYCDRVLAGSTPLDAPLDTLCVDHNDAPKYSCVDNNGGVRRDMTDPLLQDLSIQYGYCPDITDYCSTIQLTSSAETDCDGAYDAIPPLDGLDNQINMYQNQDTSATNKYIYFDHTQWSWVCASAYSPCVVWPDEIIYKSGKNDAGTPDFTTIRNTGETWTVSEWGNLGVSPTSTATFECNPPLPTPQPTTHQPTNPTAQPTLSPTNPPSKYPTVDPSVSPTRNPTVNPSVNPSANPIGSPTNPTIQPTLTPSTRAPTTSPSDNPTLHPSSSPTRTRHPTRPPTTTPTRNPSVHPTTSPTRNPSVDPSVNPTRNPSVNPTVTPTRNPTRPGETLNPTVSPTISPSQVPTRSTDTPSRSPLVGDHTHSPVTARPTDPIPTPEPTRLTYPPTPGPTPPTTADPTTAESTSSKEEGKDASFVIAPCLSTMVVVCLAYLVFV